VPGPFSPVSSGAGDFDLAANAGQFGQCRSNSPRTIPVIHPWGLTAERRLFGKQTADWAGTLPSRIEGPKIFLAFGNNSG
jgi:hypothetical protein